MGKVTLKDKIKPMEEEIKLLRVCLEQERLKNASLVERLRLVRIAAESREGE
jgi:hypothetical protein